jgi:uncharacterized protein DUF5681
MQSHDGHLLVSRRRSDETSACTAVQITLSETIQQFVFSMQRTEVSTCGSSGEKLMAIGDPFPFEKRAKKKSSKRARNHKLSPVLRAKLPRLKKRSRGKPFEPGHTIGLATRFKKGASANPGGRPSYKKYSEALRALVAADPNEEFQIDSNATALAVRVVKMGKKGNMGAIREIGDRTEGRPAITIQGDGSPDQITLLVEAMTERSKQIGHPEGWMPPLLEAGDEQEVAADDE